MDAKNLEKAGKMDEEAISPHFTLLKADRKMVSLCWEPQHTEGYASRRCLRCTMPLCDACVVKDAFGKQESTYHNRRRYVCAECWSRDEHPIVQLNRIQRRTTSSYVGLAESRRFCQCTVHDGWLCSRCKTEQNSSLATKLEQCVTEGCPHKPLNDCFGGRMCLWCDLPMPGRMSHGEARREYDSLHLRARAYSACEPLTPVEEVEDPETGGFQIRCRPKSVFLGREDCQRTLDFQRLPAPKPLLCMHSAADLPTPNNTGNHSFKWEAGLFRKMSLRIPSYNRRRAIDGQGLRSSMLKWRTSSTSLLIRHPTGDFQAQDERPSIVLYEGP